MQHLRYAAPHLYFAGLLALAAGLPVWLLLISISQFILLGAWLAGGAIKSKLRQAVTNPVIVVLCSIYLLHIAGLLFTTNFSYALDDLRVKLPLLILPLVIGTMPPLSEKKFGIVLKVLLLSTLVSTLYSTAIWAGLTDREVRDIRDISVFISHIRLSLIICMCLAILYYLCKRESHTPVKWMYYLLAAWFVVFLFILQSLTGICILIILGTAALLYKGWNSGKLARASAFVLLLVLLTGSYYLFRYLFVDSVKFTEVNRDLLLQETAKGNTYYHDVSNYELENGNPVWININEQEMEQAWNERSDFIYKGRDRNNQELRVTLIRFLASKNLLRDASGVNSLTKEEVAAVENGIANVEYMHGSNITLRLKQLAWEYRGYYYSANPSGHSVLQRMEFWKTGWYIFKKHPFTGTGTGDIKEEYAQAYEETQSVLQPEFRLRAHNEYLTMFITFGIFGGIYFLFAMLYPFFKMKKQNDFLYISALAIILLSMLMEDTPESQAGATIMAFFCSFFLFHHYGRPAET